jgi:hypothetical protein
VFAQFEAGDLVAVDLVGAVGQPQHARRRIGVGEALIAGFKHKTRRSKGGSYPLSHLYETFGLVRLTRLGHDVPWTKA